MVSNLTRNERSFLRLLLDDGRISDVEVAKKLKISSQAVGKMRKKLEKNGVIEGYTCTLNFEKLGINVLTIVLSKMRDRFWNEMGESESIEVIRKVPTSIFSCMPSGSDISLITVHAFRNEKEMDTYFHLNRVRNIDYESFINAYPFSPLNLLVDTPKHLFKHVLDDKPLLPIVLGDIHEKKKKEIRTTIHD